MFTFLRKDLHFWNEYRSLASVREKFDTQKVGGKFKNKVIPICEFIRKFFFFLLEVVSLFSEKLKDSPKINAFNISVDETRGITNISNGKPKIKIV